MGLSLWSLPVVHVSLLETSAVCATAEQNMKGGKREMESFEKQDEQAEGCFCFPRGVVANSQASTR